MNRCCCQSTLFQQASTGILGSWPFGKKNKPYFACSPDGIVLLPQELPDTCDHELAAVEIKMAVCPASVAFAIQDSGTHERTFGDHNFFFCLVNCKHRCQLLMEAYVTNVKVVIHFYTTETSAPCAVAVCFTEEMLNAAETVLIAAEDAVKWLHVANFLEIKQPAQFKEDIPPDIKEIVLTNWEWWNVIQLYVQSKDGRVYPVKTLKLGIQMIYNMLKPGVDGVTHCCSKLSSTTTKLKWEQNVWTKMLKTLEIVTVIISWIM